MDRCLKKSKRRLVKKMRSRKGVFGTSVRPRLSVFRSTKNVYAQVVDDSSGRTLVSASSFEKGYKQNASVSICQEVGKHLAERCLKENIRTVVFDRNGLVYHGRIKALADGAREGGLDF